MYFLWTPGDQNCRRKIALQTADHQDECVAQLGKHFPTSVYPSSRSALWTRSARLLPGMFGILASLYLLATVEKAQLSAHVEDPDKTVVKNRLGSIVASLGSVQRSKVWDRSVQEELRFSHTEGVWDCPDKALFEYNEHSLHARSTDTPFPGPRALPLLDPEHATHCSQSSNATQSSNAPQSFEDLLQKSNSKQIIFLKYLLNQAPPALNKKQYSSIT